MTPRSAAGDCGGGLVPVLDDLDLAGLDELLERRMLGGARGDLPRLAGTEMQLLASG
jgi:hypothetical protein